MSHTELRCRSEYVSMRDGVRLAVSTWHGNDDEKNTEKYPAVVVTTRYWRAMALQQDNSEFQSYYHYAAYLWPRGYILVVADARGSGASFGRRTHELSSAEIADIGEVINWAADQMWCDGRVAAMGTSYSANTAVFSLATRASALQLCVCRAPDLDDYRHVLAPGGVINSYFVEEWGNSTAAQDRNDAKALRESNHWSAFPGGADNVLGVRPVDNDANGVLLTAAIAEHKGNFNYSFALVDGKLGFLDSLYPDTNSADDRALPWQDGHSDSAAGFYSYQDSIEQSHRPLVIRCGWHDAGTQLGALAMFCSFSNPMRVVLGPWSHDGGSRADPFQPGDGTQPETLPAEYRLELLVNSLNTTFKNFSSLSDESQTSNQFGVVEYYTLGENQWKATKVWPLPETCLQRFYLSVDHQLSQTAPEQQNTCDRYKIDPTAGTGFNNRWNAQLGHPILFPDRQEEDQKLLVYDTPPLPEEIEITGHPVVQLFIRSTTTDGHFFAYLETIDPDGRVRMLTEGQLRALHHKVSDETPPYQMFGPYHSLKEKDAMHLIPGKVTEITFDLLPISVLLKQGQRIRLAIAGADKDMCSPIPSCERPEITLERNSVYASCIDLPFIPRDRT